MEIKQIRMGIVGAGTWGRTHASIYAEHLFADPVAICDMNEARAREIADEFGIAYDSSVRSPPKPVRREKSPMQILAEAKTKTYRVLSDYFHLLKKWERNFKPKSMDEIDARYEEAVQNLPKVECQLDILLWGTEEEKEMLVRDLGKGVEDIERRVNEYLRNQGTVNHNRQRSCEAVH